MERSVALEGMKSSIEGWRSWGIGLSILGVCASVGAVFYDPTVDITGPNLNDRVVNLQGLSVQIMLLIGGSFAALAGVICIAVSSILRAMRANIILKMGD